MAAAGGRQQLLGEERAAARLVRGRAGAGRAASSGGSSSSSSERSLWSTPTRRQLHPGIERLQQSVAKRRAAPNLPRAARRLCGHLKGRWLLRALRWLVSRRRDEDAARTTSERSAPRL
ncbi:unnamed protein product [Lampetra fluviatilis]